MAATSDNRGLTPSQVAERRHEFGWNELPETKSASPFVVFLRQFSSLLVVILIVAAVAALILGEIVDAVTIGLVVALNAALGFVQEWKAESALKSLRELMSPKAMVVRDGAEQVIPAKEIVPGDILVLSPGAKVAADAELLTASYLKVDESVLTGESVPVEKIPSSEALSVFAGTSVTSGHAEAQVTAIGSQTEFGKIADLTGSLGLKKTNLQERLGHLARQLGLAAMAIALGVVGLGLIMDRDVSEMVLTGLSLAVAMVPEGLPAVVTITLALGATAMVRQNALARRLQAVETLGAASVICTDKTGTLTENKMTATEVRCADKTYTVTGTGYDPAGHIQFDGNKVRSADDEVLEAILSTAFNCNHAKLAQTDGEWEMLGEPTEGALITLAFKGWYEPPSDTKILAEIPFSSERKKMSVLHASREGEFTLTKGAPEKVIEICSQIMTSDGTRSVTSADIQKITDDYTEMAQQGLRVLGFARRVASREIIEENLVFLGLIGMIDPPRPDVRGAIGGARSAGIKTIMITGDSPITATAIARQLSLPVTQHLTGHELEQLEDKQLQSLLKEDVLFARTKPEHKMRIVSILQAQGQIVAMTGDGVNDAPALKKADIGVAMGIRGTDVARDASDLVLLDDNFATIVRAIGEGRRQFANIRKFVRYLLSSNAGEVIALVVNIAIGGPLVFLATQILWMNLVTDGVTAVALGMEKSEPDQMREKPRKKDAEILGRWGMITIAAFGLYTGLSSLWIFFHLMDHGLELARTTAFTAMVVFEKFSVFAFRSLTLTSWRIGWFSNKFLLAALLLTLGAQVLAVYWPPLQALLRTVPIGTDEWLLIGLFVLPILIVPDLFKIIRSHLLRQKV